MKERRGEKRDEQINAVIDFFIKSAILLFSSARSNHCLKREENKNGKRIDDLLRLPFAQDEDKRE